MFCWPQDKPLTQVPASNPFEIGPLLIFAAIFAAAAVANAVMVSQFGSVGFLATVALTGTVDVDVAVLSALQTPRDVLPLEVIGRAILIARRRTPCAARESRQRSGLCLTTYLSRPSQSLLSRRMPPTPLLR